ncbi:MAG: CoA transferase [Nitriliruptorales bacterium]|nr:CoA transferase [Nitriliruptorales bacterium]
MTASQPGARGPLAGVRVLEIAGIGPGPFAAMLLSDLGADVVRVDRVGHVPARGANLQPEKDVLSRGRRSIGVDLKSPAGVEVVLRLVERADVLVEGFRPGVAERLGLGPHVCLDRNTRLVYGRMTGWGQTGPLAARAGHDLNYVAVAGALHPIGPGDRPPAVPLNYIGDFGGGGMLLAFGVACALFERSTSGRGQVVDAAMIDGAAIQTAMFHGMLAMGTWTTEREANLLDGGAPFYRCYRCADGGFVAVGALEPQFYAELLARLELEPDEWPQHDRERWPDQSRRLAGIFAGRTRDEWARVFEGSDACFAPVLSLEEAPAHPHVEGRETFVTVEGVTQPAPAPRFSRTPGGVKGPPVLHGQHTDAVLAEARFTDAEVAALRDAGAVA